MIEYIKKELGRNKSVFQSLLKDVPVEEFTWKPSPDKWCLLEIACHLLDEEIEDFGTRVRYVLRNPEEKLPSIDPVSWAKDRGYMERDFPQTVRQFIKARDESLAWLNTLIDPNWDNCHVHPKLGPMTARFFMANWLAHDHLHIRQIVKLRYDYLQHLSSTDLFYAGNW